MARRSRLVAEDVVGMMSDVETDDSDDEIGEPVCPGSDEEFFGPDIDDDR